jgi:phosphotriesterase-related protein
MTGVMTRRALLGLGLIAAACAPAPRRAQPNNRADSPARIETATGPVAADRLGITLMHEHVLVDFIGADRVSPSRYDRDEAFSVVLPHLRQAYTLGCRTLVECTPAYLGRDVLLLQRLSEASGLHILSNTGYYGAAKDKHLPAHAFTETDEQLAARWSREADRGIDATSIKPAFMKIGVDEGPLSDVDAKLVRAAALTHRRTGIPIVSHTATGVAALQQLDVLERAAVAPSAFIWVHAHNERDTSFHVRAGRRGAWLEFDGLSPASVTRHVALVVAMKAEGLLDRVLLSHDAGWYRVGEPRGGEFRPFDTLFTAFLPAARTAGLTEDEVRTLLVTNPANALTPGAHVAAGHT